MKNRFKVATFNANSIRARLPLVLKWLEREKPDVLCLQETKVQDSEFPSEAFQNSGYNVLFRGEKARAGVAIVSLEKPETFSFGFPFGHPPDEDRLVRAVIRGIPIVNTYVPQGQEVESPIFQYKLEWLERLLDFFRKNFKPEEPLIWCGDFNVAPEEIDVYDPEGLLKNVDFHPEARARLARLKEWGLVDVFRKHHPGERGQFTFWDYRVPNGFKRNLGWRIDHIWATPRLAERSVKCWIDREARVEEKPSDHTFLVAEFEL
ncbi:MAG: exodeoxyribonuclease III [Caldiserica bacterium]|jgi:exodeoxyribonuclease-3|nr:exodeoxyribonuclease III [Caldisericota bacterium]MDH7562191.1 exodeoxyribonuclease III [Caldisericota bacterium]